MGDNPAPKGLSRGCRVLCSKSSYPRSACRKLTRQVPSSTALTPRRRASIWPGDGNGSEFGRSSSSIRVEQLAPREDGTWHRGPWADAGPDSCCHRDRGRGGLTIVMQKHNLDIPIKIIPAAGLEGKLSTLRTRITEPPYTELCRTQA